MEKSHLQAKISRTKVDVAQLVEQRIVVPQAAGSSPVVHPIFFITSQQASHFSRPHNQAKSLSMPLVLLQIDLMGLLILCN